jgi:hypothetical protein
MNYMAKLSKKYVYLAFNTLAVSLFIEYCIENGLNIKWHKRVVMEDTTYFEVSCEDNQNAYIYITNNI